VVYLAIGPSCRPYALNQNDFLSRTYSSFFETNIYQESVASSGRYSELSSCVRLLFTKNMHWITFSKVLQDESSFMK